MKKKTNRKKAACVSAGCIFTWFLLTSVDASVRNLLLTYYCNKGA